MRTVQTEGLFIQSGNVGQVQELVDAFDRGLLLFLFISLYFYHRPSPLAFFFFPNFFFLLTVLFHAGEAVKVSQYTGEPNVVADLLLTFFRRLPDPPFAYELYNDLIKATTIANKKAQVP